MNNEAIRDRRNGEQGRRLGKNEADQDKRKGTVRGLGTLTHCTQPQTRAMGATRNPRTTSVSQYQLNGCAQVTETRLGRVCAESNIPTFRGWRNSGEASELF